jgi:hypothetical protein
MSITFPPKMQFVLFAPGASHRSSFIRFEGYEWTDLPQASHIVRNNYGDQFAVEIKDRCFTLGFQEMAKITQSGIPFLLGFHSRDNDDTVVLPYHGTGAGDYLKWLTEEEALIQS